MTQIISVITKEYALLASDRRLVFGGGPRVGQVADDDTCKLVSLCDICGIGYTGLARIENMPTHEWIAAVLAGAACSTPAVAESILMERASRALLKIRPSFRRQTFLIAGWWFFDNPAKLRSFFSLISNTLDDSGQPLAESRESFVCHRRALPDDKDFLFTFMGQPLRKERYQQLARNLRQLAPRGIGANATLRLLVDEILNSSLNEGSENVGSKILTFCIPKQSAEARLRSGASGMIAKRPDGVSATFAYFEPTYSELKQYGPTYVCGKWAITNVETENDPARAYQSSQFRILSGPKAKS
jgi:hypothetical protein